MSALHNGTHFLFGWCLDISRIANFSSFDPHTGQIRTMKANYKIDAGDVFVIRPLVYVRETSTRDYSVEARYTFLK